MRRLECEKNSAVRSAMGRFTAAPPVAIAFTALTSAPPPRTKVRGFRREEVL